MMLLRCARRILTAFEAAERETDPAKLAAWMTFVLVGGGGPTGAELAGALGEIANDTLKHDFRDIDLAAHRASCSWKARTACCPAILRKLSEDARKMLVDLGVTVRTGAMVTDINAEGVTIKEGDNIEKIPTRTVLWAAGVLASPLGVSLQKEAGAPLDKANRVLVEPDCTVPNHPEIFVIGDLASFSHQDGKPLPGVAQLRASAREARGEIDSRALQGMKKLKPFPLLRHAGNLATIGRGKAIADLNFVGLCRRGPRGSCGSSSTW